MSSGEQTTKLLYDHEVLRSTLALKDHYLDDIVKEIFEHTGQVLSLVRIRLSILENQAGQDLSEDVTGTGLLIGEVSARLREMSKKLFPEKYLFTDSGFIKTIEHELSKSASRNKHNLEVVGSPTTLPEGMAVILVVILVEIISSLQVSVDNSIFIKLTYTRTHLIADICFPKDRQCVSKNRNGEYAWETKNFYERLSLIGGIYSKAIEPTNIKMITLDVPIQGSF